MQIQILQIAATKNSQLAALEKDYQTRLRPFANLEVLSLPASKSDQRDRAQQEELAQFQKKLNPKATLVALDEKGKQLSSEEFADFIRQQRDFGPGKLQLLIGGSHGLHPDLIAQAAHTLALSKMTFTHEMVRVFLHEQLYRAFTILAGKRYHK